MATREVLGEIVEDAVQEARARVPVDNLNLSWMYAHFPLAWEFKAGKWLPELAQISFRKGLNGSASDGDTAAPRAHIVAKGGTLIDSGNARLGKYKNYLRRFPAFSSQSKQTGTYYASMFETPTVIGGRFAKWKLDTVGYDAFREYLVTKGILENIDLSVIEAKIDALSGTIDHLKNLPTNTLREERIREFEQQLEGMVASMEKFEATSFQSEPEEGDMEELDAAPPTPSSRRKPGKV